jgi:hypothetical protein
MTSPASAAVQSGNFEPIFNDTRAAVTRLRWRFIHPHLGAVPFAGPSGYELDVKAFCVLSYAALEQCVEEVVLATAKNRCDAFVLQNEVSRSLLSLMLAHGKRAVPQMDTANPGLRLFDVLRDALGDAKASFSRAVYNNNGIYYPQLSRLLAPVAIDFFVSPDEHAAFVALWKVRGEHAHYHTAKRVLSPEDASRSVYYCLNVVRRIAESGAKICGESHGGMKGVRVPP